MHAVFTGSSCSRCWTALLYRPPVAAAVAQPQQTRGSSSKAGAQAWPIEGFLFTAGQRASSPARHWRERPERPPCTRHCAHCGAASQRPQRRGSRGALPQRVDADVIPRRPAGAGARGCGRSRGAVSRIEPVAAFGERFELRFQDGEGPDGCLYGRELVVDESCHVRARRRPVFTERDAAADVGQRELCCLRAAMGADGSAWTRRGSGSRWHDAREHADPHVLTFRMRTHRFVVTAAPSASHPARLNTWRRPNQARAGAACRVRAGYRSATRRCR